MAAARVRPSQSEPLVAAALLEEKLGAVTPEHEHGKRLVQNSRASVRREQLHFSKRRSGFVAGHNHARPICERLAHAVVARLTIITLG
jgi:hypothetical protein